MPENSTTLSNDEYRTSIECLDDYIIAINKMRKHVREEEGEDADNQHFFFRGQANEAWDISPGIFRGKLLSFESELMQMAYLRNPADFRNLGSNFERLAKLQHYGLPTRLLDVTSNPLVALYFACQPHKEPQTAPDGDEREYYVETDGAVFFQRAYCKGYDEQEVMLHAYVAGLDLRGDMTLEKLLEDLEEHRIYTSKAAQMCREKGYRSLIDILQSNYFVISNLNNDRLIRQSGSFLLCGQYNIILDSKQPGNSVLQKADGVFRGEFEQSYFSIPMEKKKGILDELDFYNINEGSLFPELEHQMTYIKAAQSGKSAQAIGRFTRVTVETSDPSAEATVIVGLNDAEITDVIRNAIEEKIEPALQQSCLESISSNITIDWYQKENVQSKMRLDLAKVLETTAHYDRIAAKKKAHELIAYIISRLV